MSIEDKIKERITSLIENAQDLSEGDKHGQVLSSDHESKCKGWLAAAANIIQLICADSASAYKNEFQKILDANYGYNIPQAIGDGRAILEALLSDINNDLLASIADSARAETFDNFLDHAKDYFDAGEKRESGVIAGVVFEDTIRRLCDKHKISQTGVNLDELISQLAKSGIFSGTKAKRARVSAHVRTKATHAQWDEFDLSDVEVTIGFTEEIIVNHIDD